MTYAVAKRLGFAPGEVRWIYTPFNKTIAPGRKAFDFAINQISYTPDRARVLTFSSSYYNVNQSIVGLKGKPIASVRSKAGLKRYKLGAQIGTTSYQYIVRSIRPSQPVRLRHERRGGCGAEERPDRRTRGRPPDRVLRDRGAGAERQDHRPVHPAVGNQERFGMVFQKGNSLAGCVNQALAQMRRTGILKRIQQIWLAKVTGAPVLQ